MPEANFSILVIMFLCVFIPIAISHQVKLLNKYNPSFISSYPISFLSVLFGLIAAILYMVCVTYTDNVNKAKKLNKVKESDVKIRDNLFISSMVFSALTVIALIATNVIEK
jgi:formate hydrogenlyase subunit 3/multisubunit Na+/H+ antiporter MnhD subunit